MGDAKGVREVIAYVLGHDSWCHAQQCEDCQPCTPDTPDCDVWRKSEEITQALAEQPEGAGIGG